MTSSRIFGAPDRAVIARNRATAIVPPGAGATHQVQAVLGAGTVKAATGVLVVTAVTDVTIVMAVTDATIVMAVAVVLGLAMIEIAPVAMVAGAGTVKAAMVVATGVLAATTVVDATVVTTVAVAAIVMTVAVATIGVVTDATIATAAVVMEVVMIENAAVVMVLEAEAATAGAEARTEVRSEAGSIGMIGGGIAPSGRSDRATPPEMGVTKARVEAVRMIAAAGAFGIATTIATSAVTAIADRGESAAMKPKTPSRRIASTTAPAASAAPVPRSGAA